MQELTLRSMEQNRSLKKMPTHMDTWYMTEFVLQISEVLFSINDAGTTGSPYKK